MKTWQREAAAAANRSAPNGAAPVPMRRTGRTNALQKPPTYSITETWRAKTPQAAGKFGSLPPLRSDRSVGAGKNPDEQRGANKEKIMKMEEQT